MPLLFVFIFACNKDDDGNECDTQEGCEAILSIKKISHYSAEAHFNWNCTDESNITRIGIAYNVNQPPEESDSIVWLEELENDGLVILGDLKTETKYYIKVVTETNCNRWYSNSESFITNAAPTFVYDIENNKYPTVFINGQEWMAEGLRTSKYNDGTSILLIENLHNWPQDSIGVYANYDNIPARSDRAGALYNWQAVNSGKLCPQGWRVPTAQDFNNLSDYLGGNAVAGGPLKRANSKMWNPPNRDATNETGFSAVGGGIVYHEIIGNFGSRGVISVLWSSTEHDADRAYYRLLHFNDGHFVSKRGKKTHGMCVRCVRDE